MLPPHINCIFIKAQIISIKVQSWHGPFKCFVTLFSWKLDTHPPPRNANNIEAYTFETLFPGKVDTPHPHLRYVTLEWLLNGISICRQYHARHIAEFAILDAQ